jgi:hypothetical protein
MAEENVQPLVVALNWLEDPSLEQDALSGAAAVSAGRVETAAAAVLFPSLAFQPRAAQRRLRPWLLLLCLGSVDRAADTAAAAELSLRLIHGREAQGLKSRCTLLGSLPPRRRHVHRHPPPPCRPQHSAVADSRSFYEQVQVSITLAASR